MHAPTYLTDITAHLAQRLTTDRYPANEWGTYVPGLNSPIRRLGLALEPSPRLANWVRTEQFDALWLHRPWRLDTRVLPPNVPVLFHHLPFDEHLTTGMNEPLAAALGMTKLDELGYKQIADERGNLLPRRAIGMIGQSPERTHDTWLALLKREFGGYDREEPGAETVHSRVAVVGAMNPALVKEAHERGVTLYLTGEYRKGTQDTVDETGMAVIALGHRRTEEWGLRALRTLLREQWPELAVVTFG